ncbi:MAG: ROK family protein [Candidatus Limnocylindrales bacterium]
MSETVATPALRQAGKDPLEPFLAAPRVVPPLDVGFRPILLARRELEAAAARSGRGVRVTLAVEQPGWAACVRDAVVFPDGDARAAAGHLLCERLLKSMLWARGGSRIWVDGPAGLVDAVRRHYDASATGRFDVATIATTVFEEPFEVVAAARSDFPVAGETTTALGGHLDGCRIGFDLGASDRKAAAVIDGQVVFSEEVVWDPVHQPDPQWHFDQIMDSLHRAALHLPRVDAIGCSAAGIYVDGRVRVASLFRAVPPALFRSRVADLFLEVQAAWGGIPFALMNDGDVTALSGAMLAGVGGLLGIAMGSSEAAGYVTRERTLTRRLNELAFVPLDAAPDGPIDDWSGDRGCGAQYLSQQAVGRLLPVAGIDVAAGTPLPDQLLLLQSLMADGDDRARRVYQTIGTYLGYALLDYRTLYDVDHVLVLGRVTSGPGGDAIVDRAEEVLRAEDPGAAAAVAFHRVSERDKRHGQAVAAASLPSLPQARPPTV